jgi:hypothetical protein
VNKEMEAIFRPLKARLEGSDLTDIDLVELIGGFAGSSPHIAQALAYHARDFMRECNASQVVASYASIITETYRRTFFDEEHAVTYGTTEMLDKGPEMLKAFAAYLVCCIDMDDHQSASGSYMPEARGRH